MAYEKHDPKMMEAMKAPSLNSKGGHDPMVPRKEKHSVKDKGFFNKKKAKGDC
jgi:hypothetical protein